MLEGERELSRRRAGVVQVREVRDRRVLRAPFAGVILERPVDPGQTVASSFNTPTLFVIAQDLSQMKLEVAIDEADVGAVKLGQKANFTVDAFPGRRFPAQITRVDLGSNLTVSAASSSSSTLVVAPSARVMWNAATAARFASR